jgi:hypothetical protein
MNNNSALASFMREYPYNNLMNLRGTINDLQMEERLTKRAQDKLCYIDSQLLDIANFLYRLRQEMIKQPTVTLGDPCPSCGGTDWICAGCQEKDVYT